MSEFKPRRCLGCGEGTVCLQYQSTPLLVEPVAVPTCSHCGALWINPATAEALDRASERTPELSAESGGGLTGVTTDIYDESEPTAFAYSPGMDDDEPPEVAAGSHWLRDELRVVRETLLARDGEDTKDAAIRLRDDLRQLEAEMQDIDEARGMLCGELAINDPGNTVEVMRQAALAISRIRVLRNDWASDPEIALQEVLADVDELLTPSSKLVSSTHIDKETPNGSRVISMELTEDTRRALTVNVKSAAQVEGQPSNVVQTFDPEQRAREKQASRDADAAALVSGEKTVAQLRAENSAFAFPRDRVRLTPPKRER